MNISADDVQQFQNDGVVCLAGALDERWLQACAKAWQWSVGHPGPLASALTPGAPSATQDLCNPNALPEYRALLEGAPLAGIAGQLMGSASVWFMYEQVFNKWGESPRTPWHQDTSYLALNGEHLLAFWISLDAVPAERALEFVRGSHRGPLYNTSRFDAADPTAPIFPSETLPSLPDIEADREQFDIVSYATQPGDIIAFHTSMLHGGGATDDTTPLRRTLTLRFFGEGAYFQSRPGPAGPFFLDIKDHIVDNAPFRHERFAQLI